MKEHRILSWIECVGALHVHTRYSDGTASVEEIVEAARRAHVDFVVLSDHDTLAARREGWEKRHNGVVLLVATEITPASQGHLLAMNVSHCEGYAAQHNTHTLDAIQEQGGYAIVAHPAGKRKPSLAIHQRPWYDWTHPVVRGLEIWSYLHDWIDDVAWWRLPQAYEFWQHPERRLSGPDPRVLAQWDRMGRRRRFAGLAGLDCHAKRVPLAGISIFPYEKMFRSLRNHVLIPEQAWRETPTQAGWEALAEGRGFISHDALADASGARCWAERPNGSPLQMGEEAPYEPGTVMRLELPTEAEVRWIADGRCRLADRTRVMEAVPAGPGVFRFEATINGLPWFFGNPIYLR